MVAAPMPTHSLRVSFAMCVSGGREAGSDPFPAASAVYTHTVSRMRPRTRAWRQGDRMILAIADVLSAADVEEVRAGLATATVRRRQGDGRAGRRSSSSPTCRRARRRSSSACARSSRRGSWSMPCSRSRPGPRPSSGPLFSRYQPGHAYGAARRRCADGRRADRRLLHAVPVRPGELRRRRAGHRHARRRGGVQARARQRRHLSRHHAAPRGAGDARRAAGGGGLGAQLRARRGAAASCCSTWRPRAGACSTARARPRRATSSPSAPPTSCAMWCED